MHLNVRNVYLLYLGYLVYLGSTGAILNSSVEERSKSTRIVDLVEFRYVYFKRSVSQRDCSCY